MQIGELIKLRKQEAAKSPVCKITNRRQAIVKEFVDAINAEREGTSFRPIQARTVAIKLSFLNEQDLYFFLSECRDYRKRKGSFSKLFFGALKVK